MAQFNIESHINDFIKGKYVVNCKTQKLAEEFLNYCDKLGIKWCTGRELIDNSEWERYKEETSYHHNSHGIEFGSANFYEKESEFIIIEFTGFDTYTHKQQPKPPVMPKYIYESQRVQELCRALCEYSISEKVNYELMIKWSEELNDRLYGLKGDEDFDLCNLR